MYELRFPIPENPLSINRAKHWAKTRRLLAPWRDAVGWAWNTTRRGRREITNVPCDVYVTIPFDVTPGQWEGKRRDPHNYVGTVCKAIIDQLVEQGAWPDDTPEWVTVHEPTLVRGNEVVVSLVPRGEAA